jgi:hypothetical protein
MAQNFPELTQLKAAYLLEFEGRINQESPLNNKAFLRILSSVLAMIAVLLRVEIVGASKENLAITASRAGLIDIGNEYDTPIKDEVSAILLADLPATTGTVIPANTNFTSVDTGVLYFNTTSVTAAAGVAALSLTSRSPGVIGNLNNGQTLKISVQISGSEEIATVTDTDTLGADAEDTEDYRQRVLDIIRAPGGGANSADFRNWAQEEENVIRAYPYSGLEVAGTGAPPDRTVFIEADESVDPDGIAPAPLIASTKLTIITDPITGQHRQPLGITNDTLGVFSITRKSFFTQIAGATFVGSTEAAVKDAIDLAVAAFYKSLEPFIPGLDIDTDRNDKITAPALSEIIQGVLKANGASAQTISFGESPGTFIPEYILAQGEKAKDGGVSYV